MYCEINYAMNIVYAKCKVAHQIMRKQIKRLGHSIVITYCTMCIIYIIYCENEENQNQKIPIKQVISIPLHAFVHYVWEANRKRGILRKTQSPQCLH